MLKEGLYVDGEQLIYGGIACARKISLSIKGQFIEGEQFVGIVCREGILNGFVYCSRVP